MCPHTGLDHIARKHVEDVESMLKTRLVALGLWSDGVLVNWDRSESIQCVTWALPGLPSALHGRLRLPFTVLPKHFCAQETMDFVLELSGWSLKQMMLGKFPLVMHNGGPFADKYRQSLAGKPIGVQAILAELKGDWEFFADILHLPRWNNTEGLCFLCRATKAHLSSRAAQQSNLDAIQGKAGKPTYCWVRLWVRTW